MENSDTMLVISSSTAIGAAIGYFFFNDLRYASVIGGGLGFFVGVICKLGVFDALEAIVDVFD